MRKPFDNKVVAITGAGKGLGRAYAHHFAALGARVVVNNRRHEGEQQSSADRVVEEIVNAGGQAVAEWSSVEDQTAGDKLLACALAHYDRLDFLVANAGVTEGRSFRKQRLEEFRAVLEINLMGTVNVVHPVFRHLCEHGGGNIIVSTSSAGLFGGFGLPGYSTAKAAVIGLMRSLSLEGAPKKVWVNAIAPYAATQMTKAHLPDELASGLDPAEVATVVAWLANSTVSGEVLIAGGGRVARARMKTSAAVPVPEMASDDWQSFCESAVDVEFDSAGEHFEEFAASLKLGGDTQKRDS
ncbi:MAG: SDR family NAD(P)-dependent oxidoreductase [Gammaproteobacteria bacterium]|nr:SDR family NAD(P)-dependent oxidoreductase [Gammaproteobacteria bacterium]